MDFCDLKCTYANWPKEEAVDGSGSCRTFVGLYCSLKKRIVMKNAPCEDKDKIYISRDRELKVED